MESTNCPETIGGVVDRAATLWPDVPAVVEGDVTVSYAELRERALGVAAALQSRGLRRGDRVALWGPNSLAWIEAAFGAAYCGIAVVPLNTRYKPPEAVDIAARSGVKLAFCSGGFLGNDYASTLRSAGHHVVELDELAGFVSEFDDAVRSIQVQPDDISHIQYTSGTTGAPKGAMLRHRAMAGTTKDWAANVGLAPGDRYMIVSPFYHISGHKTGVLACVTAGATIYPVPVFDAEAVMRQVQAARINVLPGPPTIYQTLLAHPKRAEYDLSSLELAVTGAASIPPVLISRMFDELGFTRVIAAYGITETTGVVTMCRPGDSRELIAETSGRAVPGVEARIAPDTGEILVRGYNVMAGYLDDPVATAEAIDADGWFHSGDVGSLDEAGNLRITDRIKDMFICGGFNVYPAEVEHTLVRHPNVVEAAVIGVPDDRMGEVGHAFVVVSTPLDEAELLAMCRERLANFKVPRSVEVVDELPKNASGKVLKFELRQRGAGR